jgi:hypothetical protein
MKISPARGASDVWNNSPPGGGFTQIQQLFTVFGGSRKVTFMVTPPGYAPNATSVVHATATAGDWLREAGASVTVRTLITHTGRGGGV